MRLRARRRTLVLWSSSAVPATRSWGSRGGGRMRPRRGGQVRWWLRTGTLLAVVGALRLTRTARARWEPVCLVAGTLLTVLGFMLPAVAVFYAGLLTLVATLVKGIAKKGRDAGLSAQWR
jgi:hypothetical protein